MTEKDVRGIPTMKQFYELRDMLNLSDRQRDVFYYKYSKFWRNIDIAEELGVSKDTITTDLKDIKEKLKYIAINSPEAIDFFHVL